MRRNCGTCKWFYSFLPSEEQERQQCIELLETFLGKRKEYKELNSDCCKRHPVYVKNRVSSKAGPLVTFHEVEADSWCNEWELGTVRDENPVKIEACPMWDCDGYGGGAPMNNRNYRWVPSPREKCLIWLDGEDEPICLAGDNAELRCPYCTGYRDHPIDEGYIVTCERRMTAKEEEKKSLFQEG